MAHTHQTHGAAHYAGGVYAPQVGIYEFELSISDGIDTSTTRHIVTVVNELPPSLNYLELLLGFDDSNNIDVWDILLYFTMHVLIITNLTQRKLYSKRRK